MKKVFSALLAVAGSTAIPAQQPDTSLQYLVKRNWLEVNVSPPFNYLAGGYPLSLRTGFFYQHQLSPVERWKIGATFDLVDPEYRDELYSYHTLEVYDSIEFVSETYSLENFGFDFRLGYDRDLKNKVNTFYGGIELGYGYRLVVEELTRNYMIVNTSLGCLTCMVPSPLHNPEVRSEQVLYHQFGLAFNVGYRVRTWKNIFTKIQLTSQLVYASEWKSDRVYLNTEPSLHKNWLAMWFWPLEIHVAYNFK